MKDLIRKDFEFIGGSAIYGLRQWEKEWLLSCSLEMSHSRGQHSQSNQQELLMRTARRRRIDVSRVLGTRVSPLMTGFIWSTTSFFAVLHTMLPVDEPLTLAIFLCIYWICRCILTIPTISKVISMKFPFFWERWLKGNMGLQYSKSILGRKILWPGEILFNASLVFFVAF